MTPNEPTLIIRHFKIFCDWDEWAEILQYSFSQFLLWYTMTRRSMQESRELLSIPTAPTAPQNLLQRLSRPYLQFLSTLAQQPIFTRWHEEVCILFFLFVLEQQPIFTRCQFKLPLCQRWKCCLWKSKLEVSSAFRLLAGRWKTASIVEKKRKNSTDRKLTVQK